VRKGVAIPPANPDLCPEFAPVQHMFQSPEARLPDTEEEGGGDAGYVSDPGGHDTGCGYEEWSTLLLESAGRVTGWTAEDVAGAVERVERRLGRWWKRRKGELDGQIFVV
jgi:hypothetical protein